MPSKKDILDQIAALQAEADGMGDEEDFEIEIWNDKGEGARLPHSRTEPWLKTKFPELFTAEDPPAEEEGEGKDPKTKPKATQTKTPPGRTGNTATRYFGKRPAGK
jgi:hypothetical protein